MLLDALLYRFTMVIQVDYATVVSLTRTTKTILRQSKMAESNLWRLGFRGDSIAKNTSDLTEIT